VSYVYIQQPAPDYDTDENDALEDCDIINNLNGNQLLAESETELFTGEVIGGDPILEDYDSDERTEVDVSQLIDSTNIYLREIKSR
jgi:hypothetical protein